MLAGKPKRDEHGGKEPSVAEESLEQALYQLTEEFKFCSQSPQELLETPTETRHNGSEKNM